MWVSAFFDVFFVAKRGIIICQKVLISQKTRRLFRQELFAGVIMKSGKIDMDNIVCMILGKGDKRHERQNFWSFAACRKILYASDCNSPCCRSVASLSQMKRPLLPMDYRISWKAGHYLIRFCLL